jgi:hypothetical protein
MYAKKKSAAMLHIFDMNYKVWAIIKNKYGWYSAVSRFSTTRFRTKKWAFFFLKSKSLTKRK